MRPDGDLGRYAVDGPPGRPGQPYQVGRDQVGRGAELIQVPAAAKRRAGAAQLDRLDRLVGYADQQRVEQRFAQPGAERVAPRGVVEYNREPPAVPAELYRLGGRLAVARGAALAASAGELRPAEQQ
jgi:hypothetical protein